MEYQVYPDPETAEVFELLTGSQCMARLDRLSPEQNQTAIERLTACGVTRDFFEGVIHLPDPKGRFVPWVPGGKLAAVIATAFRGVTFAHETPATGRRSPTAALSWGYPGRYRAGLGVAIEHGELYPVAVWRWGARQPVRSAMDWAAVLETLGQAAEAPHAGT